MAPNFRDDKANVVIRSKVVPVGSVVDDEVRRELLAQNDALNLRLQNLQRQKYNSKRVERREKDAVSSMTDICQSLCLLQIRLSLKVKAVEKQIQAKFRAYLETKRRQTTKPVAVSQIPSDYIPPHYEWC